MRRICCIIIIQSLSVLAIALPQWVHGDIIERAIVSGIKLTDSICDITLAEIEDADVELRISRLPDGHSWVVREKRQRFYFDCRGDSLLWTGYENRLQHMTGNGAMVLLPDMHGDSCVSYFNFKGMHSLIYPMSEVGEVRSTINPMVLVVGGDTVQNAQAVRTLVRSAITDSSAVLPSAQESVRIYLPDYPYAAVEFRSVRPADYIPGTLSGLQWDHVSVSAHLLSQLRPDTRPEIQRTNDRMPFKYTVNGRNVEVEVQSDCTGCKIEVSLCSLGGIAYISRREDNTSGLYSVSLPLPSEHQDDCMLVVRIGDVFYKQLIRRQ